MYIYDGKVSHMHRRMCEWDYIQSINRSFVYKAKEGRHVRIEYNIPMEEKSKSYRQETKLSGRLLCLILLLLYNSLEYLGKKKKIVNIVYQILI
jgi:hypothetical protein